MDSCPDKAALVKIKRILDNHFTLPILVSIAEGKRPSYIAKKRLNISEQLLHYHLKRLIGAGFVIKLGNLEDDIRDANVIRNIKKSQNNGSNSVIWQLTDQGQLVLKGLLRRRVNAVGSISDSIDNVGSSNNTNHWQLSTTYNHNNTLSKRCGCWLRGSVRLHDIRVSFPLLFVPESLVQQATPLNNGVLRITDKRPQRTVESFWKSASIDKASLESTPTACTMSSLVVDASGVNRQNGSKDGKGRGELIRRRVGVGYSNRNDVKKGGRAILLVHMPPRYFSDPINGFIAQYDLARKYAKAQAKGWGMQIFEEGKFISKPHLGFRPDPAILFLSEFETAVMETQEGDGKAWFDQSTGKTEQETDDIDYALKALQVPESVSDILLLSNSITERLDRMNRLFNGYERHYDPCLTWDN